MNAGTPHQGTTRRPLTSPVLRREATHKTMKLFAIATFGLLVPLASTASGYSRPGETEQVSLSVDNREPAIPATCLRSIGNRAYRSSSSADGRFIAFEHPGTNLTPRLDVNMGLDVFVQDRKNGTTELASVSPIGFAGTGLPQGLDLCSIEISIDPHISGNGRFVAFTSSATDLVTGDTNLTQDVFIFDRLTTELERISVDSQANEANGPSFFPSISATGRYVSFTSAADNLVSGDLNLWYDVFLYDRRTNETVLLTKGGRRPNKSEPPHSALSPDGRYVGLDIYWSEKHPERYDNQVILQDIKQGTLETVTTQSTHQEVTSSPHVLHANQNQNASTSTASHISADNRFILFTSQEPGLVPNDDQTTGFDDFDAFVFDRRSGRLERVSVDSFGREDAPGVHEGWEPTMSLDGRLVAFRSRQKALDSGDTDQAVGYTVNVHDRTTGATGNVGVNSQGEEARGCTSVLFPEYDNPLNRSTSTVFSPDISGDGRYVSFSSCDYNLTGASSYDSSRITPDEKMVHNIFVHDFGTNLGLGALSLNQPRLNSESQICTTSSDCLTPGEAITSSDKPLDDVSPALTRQGANLYAMTLVHRPLFDDVFAVIELEHMPHVLPGLSPIFYGLRFEVGEKSYEVRATSLLGGTFGLLDCTDTRICTKIADLRGGYGTTGERVVFSLPLADIGLQDGGELSDLEAFSALGSYFTGTAKVLDTVTLQ